MTLRSRLSTVVRDILGVSDHAMIDALIGGQRDPKVLAEMAKDRMRVKISAVQEALTRDFDDGSGRHWLTWRRSPRCTTVPSSTGTSTRTSRCRNR